MYIRKDAIIQVKWNFKMQSRGSGYSFIIAW